MWFAALRVGVINLSRRIGKHPYITSRKLNLTYLTSVKKHRFIYPTVVTMWSEPGFRLFQDLIPSILLYFDAKATGNSCEKNLSRDTGKMLYYVWHLSIETKETLIAEAEVFSSTAIIFILHKKIYKCIVKTIYLHTWSSSGKTLEKCST